MILLPVRPESIIKFSTLSDLKPGRHKVFGYRPDCTLTAIGLTEPIHISNPVDIEYHCIKLYPNPASSVCYVECNMPALYTAANIYVANISTGNVVKRFLNVRNNTTVEINASDMPNGEYIVKMILGDSASTRNGGTEKLIVNH